MPAAADSRSVPVSAVGSDAETNSRGETLRARCARVASVFSSKSNSNANSPGTIENQAAKRACGRAR